MASFSSFTEATFEKNHLSWYLHLNKLSLHVTYDISISFGFYSECISRLFFLFSSLLNSFIIVTNLFSPTPAHNTGPTLSSCLWVALINRSLPGLSRRYRRPVPGPDERLYLADTHFLTILPLSHNVSQRTKVILMTRCLMFYYV
jgi:hypothetical protein